MHRSGLRTSPNQKTVSAVRYNRAEMIIQVDRWTSESRHQLPVNTLVYATSVINAPSRIDCDIHARD